jgi:3',5'-cyclic AMP phosphodiesterase CpdA
MTEFDAKDTRYDASRDVRDHTHLIRLLRALPQEGVLFPLVGTRRAGKTWALKALESALKQIPGKTALYVDLRRLPSELPGAFAEECLLLDEPELSGEGTRVRDSKGFLRWCLKLYESKKILLVAMSPAEWVALQQAGEPLKFVSPRELQFLKPLDAVQAEHLARTEQAKQLLPRLGDQWKKNPFLLELFFQVAEEQKSGVETDLWELHRQVRDKSDSKDFFYFNAVYWNGLTDGQRALLKSVAHGTTWKEEFELLTRCGLVAKKGAYPVIADPILEAKLCPLRIHHISDLHFGPKSAERVDVKEKGAHAERIAPALGPKHVRDQYLDYVAGLKNEGKAPHLLVISGDIAEWADDTQFAEARTWLDQLRGHLADHPRLKPTEPHILLVGGNHDVDWRQTEGPGGAGARKRHLPFARAFDTLPRSLRVRLENPPGPNRLAVARYEDLEVEVLLLGSAEFGGEEEKDPVREQLHELVDRLRKAAMALPDEEKVKSLRHSVSKLDPGVVDGTDLAEVGKQTWTRAVRIAVLHHPVSPLPTTELARYVGLINAGEVKERLLEKGFCLVLHGHAHTGWFGKESWPGQHNDHELWIASAPSLGSREVREKNGFNEIEISQVWEGKTTTWEITLRRYASGGIGWAFVAEKTFRPRTA